MTVRSPRPPARHPATAANGGAAWDWMRPAAQMAAPVADAGYTGYARVATRALSLEPVSVGRARDFTMATVRRWGLAALADDIGIVVSELLTNALRHGRRNRVLGPARRTAGWPIRLGLLCPGSCVLCAVADPSDEVPEMREPDYLAETGRGLHVIDSLSESWGWTIPDADGKVVWALFVPEWRFEELEIPGPACSPVAAVGSHLPPTGLASSMDI